MSKPKYVNRFSVMLNSAAQEADLAFFTVSTQIDEELNPAGQQCTEVCKLVMTEYNLRELHKIIGTILEKSDTPKDKE